MSSVDERIDIVRKNLEKLEGQNVNSGDFYHFQGVKHTLQEAVEGCIDIASHIIAEKGFGNQKDYSDYFEELGNQEVISNELADKLEEMARFRNFLVHNYPEIDEERLQRIIDEDLKDIEKFLEEVINWIEGE